MQLIMQEWSLRPLYIQEQEININFYMVYAYGASSEYKIGKIGK